MGYIGVAYCGLGFLIGCASLNVQLDKWGYISILDIIEFLLILLLWPGYVASWFLIGVWKSFSNENTPD